MLFSFLLGNAPSFVSQQHQLDDITTYDQLLLQIAAACEDFSGAQLAGVVRAGASHALERAVNDFARHPNGDDSVSIMDCLVTADDFFEAIVDVQSSMGTFDHSEEEDEDDSKKDDNESNSIDEKN